MYFVKFSVIIGLGGSLLMAAQEYQAIQQVQEYRVVVPIIILVIHHNIRQNQINLQEKKRKEEQLKNQKYITFKQKKSEQKRTKNKNSKQEKYVGKYNGHIYPKRGRKN